MIHKFSFNNFYSFRDEVKIDFEVNNKAPETDAYVINSKSPNLSKILTVIGPNASGKTNLLKVIPFLQFFIIDSFSHKAGDKIPFNPFIFDANKKPSEFMVEFEIEKKTYQYKLVLTVNKVISEILRVKTNDRFSTLFKREWNEELKKYKLNLKNYILPTDFPSLLRENASIISTANQIDHKLSLKIVSYWQNIQTNVHQGGRILTKDNHKMSKVSEFFYKHSDLKKNVNDLLIKFDLGLSGIDVLKREFKNEKNELQTIYIPFGVHKNLADEKVPAILPFFEESSGTQNLFLISFQILNALENGGMIILDEFDADLHPSMIPELVNLFISPISNKKNAQLLFSTHNPQILNSLDKYQVILCEKDDNGCSECWRLDDIEGVRSDDNYYAKYMSGAYGAVPRL